MQAAAEMPQWLNFRLVLDVMAKDAAAITR
jgi:hypothetical protein